MNLAPNLQSRNCDQTSTKITRQNNLRYIKVIKPNVSHRNPIFVALHLELSFQLFEEKSDDDNSSAYFLSSSWKKKKSSNHRIQIDYRCYLTSFTLLLFIILGLLNWMTSLKKKVMMTTPLLRRQSFPVQVLTVQTALLGCRVAVVDIEINKSIQNPPVRLHQPMAESERPP